MSAWIEAPKGHDVYQNRAREPFKFHPHAPISTKRNPWPTPVPVLRPAVPENDFTRWCLKTGCNNEDHPEFRRRRESAGR